MTQSRLRLVVLTGSDSAATCLSISSLLDLSNVEVAGIVFDDERPTIGRQLRNLRRNVRREGISYLWFRAGEAASEWADRQAARVVPRDEVEKVLRESFPERAFSLADFARIYNIPVFSVGNINSAKAVETLRRLRADVGIVLGTRILKRSTFSVPRVGCVNLHKGKVPEYRGLPPGFWELYDGQTSAGVTAHFVDDGLDTGAVLGEASVPIHSKDVPETLRRKLDYRGSQLLAECVSQLVEGRAVPRPQLKSQHKARTAPTRGQRLALERKLGLVSKQRSPWVHLVKTLFYLSLYYSGIFALVRAVHRRSSSRRSCILLYHRVNDLTTDVLTTGVKRFAEHMVILKKRYTTTATTQLVRNVRVGDRVAGSSVAIHFDDCYRDVYTNASHVLARLRLPACAFISSGFINTERIFPHDAEKCPFHLENLREEEVRGLTECGLEIGAHTVNHSDLGRCDNETTVFELQESKRALEKILGRPVNLVSYPYGRKQNIQAYAVEAARRLGYEAMFSAYGGYVDRNADPFDLRRIGISGDFRPLDLLMEIEGLSLGALKRVWSRAGQEAS